MPQRCAAGIARDCRWNPIPRLLSAWLPVLPAVLLAGLVWLTGVAAAQSPPAAAAGNAVRIAAMTMDGQARSFVLIAFDQPVAQGRVGKITGGAPAVLDPRIEGTWSWISPFVLRFDANTPLRQNARYKISFNQARLLPKGMRLADGETAFLKTGVFGVRKLEVTQETDPKAPAKTILRGVLELSEAVDPEQLLKFLTLKDPAGKQQEISLQTTWRSRHLTFAAGPFPRTKDAAKYTFTLAKGLRQAEGDLELEAPFTRLVTVQLNPNLTVKNASAVSRSGQGTVTITLSAGVEQAAARDAIRVEPPVAYSVVASGEEVLLNGKFAPGQTYTITLAKGLKALDGARLQQGVTVRADMPDLEPTLGFSGKGVFLSKAGFKTLGLTSVNTDTASLAVDRVYRNNLFLLLGQYSSGTLLEDENYGGEVYDYLGDRLLSKDITLPADTNVEQATPLELDSLIPADEKGLFRISAALPGRYSAAQRWVLLTDIGLVAKLGVDELVVSAASVDSLQALPDVRLTLLSYQNQVLATGKTSEQGLWEVALDKAALEKHRPYLLLAETDDDFSFLLFDQFRIDQTGQDVGGLQMAQAGYTAYLYGERDLYRPGETAHGVALLRDASLGTPPAMPLKLVHKDPRGQELAAMVIKSDAQGVATFDLDIPPFALTGRYLVECLVADKVVGEYRYQVEEFLPDRIKVDVQAPDAEPRVGQALRFTVDSRYFFGPPASALPVEATVRLKPAPFSSKAFPGYLFGNADLKFQDQEIFNKEGVLDEEGRISLETVIPEGVRPPAALQAEMVARVRERGGRGVAARLTRTVHAYARYVGIKQLGRTGVNPGEPMTFDYVVVDPDGNRTEAAASLKAVIWKDQWQTVLRKTPSGSFRYESERQSVPMEELSLTAAGGQGSFQWTPPDFGSYRVEIADEQGGAASQATFYAGGWGYSPWAVENPATLELVPDKAEYKPGETATVQIRAPFAGRVLVTVEKDRVYDLQLHPMEGNTATVSFPVTEAYSPNVYISAILVRKAGEIEPGMVGRAAGWTPLFVDREANRPAIAFSLPPMMRPEGPLTIEAVTDPDAVVTLAAVDEGILQLINQKTPNPFGHFYAKRALEMNSYDTFAMLLPEVNPTEGRSPAGGDDGRAGQFVRTESLRRVKPVRFWSGPLVADSQGKVRWTIEVPDFNGALRVMAVVAKGKRFGSAQEQVQVRAPVIVSATFPRFLSFGEAVKIPVSVRNDIGQDATFQVQLMADGPAGVKGGNQTVAVSQGRESLVYFDLTTEDAEGIVAATATAGTMNGTQALSGKDGVEFMVRAPLPARTVVESGSLAESSVTVAIPTEAAFIPGTVRREVHVGRFPLLRYAGSLKDLLGYPYGCLEQTVSQAFPLLYFADMAAALEPALFRQRSAQAMVQSAIRRVQTMQTQDGGFAMWPGSKKSWPWATVQAAHFLTEAKAAGFQVGEAMYAKTLDALGTMLKEHEDTSSAGLKTLAYAAFVLAKAGKADRGSMDYLQEEHGKALRPGAATLLGGAFALSGNVQAMESLLEHKWKVEDLARSTGGALDSSIGNLALRVLVLQEVLPGDRRVEELIRHLVRLMDASRFRSTQENSFAFLALGSYFRAQQAKGPFSGAVYRGEEKLGTFSDTAPLSLTGTKAIMDDGPLTIALDPGSAPQEGAVYYTVFTTGLPETASHKPVADGLELQREFLTRDGKPVNMQALKQGDLVVMRTRLRSTVGGVDNVAVSTLLPAGLEVENPRLATSERLPWVEQVAEVGHQDIRDDRIVTFLDLPGKDWVNLYALLRAVTPGAFITPPAQAEAMYDPALLATGELSTTVIGVDQTGGGKAAPVPTRTIKKKTAEEADSGAGHALASVVQ
ncbi:alpha-2-macroglobulin family protein [Megalodesulfovibrio gigas]|uniref:Putative alpha-2-macroglobulin domain protein 2 n=1 Tax=Megalodesulfovibrio gigas (strain ATCC 19364 / DSM 1382 / NCIMB 9332 / VKM B-1759) TaxID=1121448 RepID=T2GEA3_MEGG1|nr:MG2 domain-containing protein [Megalodesulfovibrio gigas]AGW14588.1 putative alpha-2-macroglobulin domain protein 2 [Megalodesulfovibrio gigas DSM 1382 = ATCC 19364]